MTYVEWWEEAHPERACFAVNGCLLATVTHREALGAKDYADLVAERVYPLIWLAMPGHEDHKPTLA